MSREVDVSDLIGALKASTSTNIALGGEINGLKLQVETLRRDRFVLETKLEEETGRRQKAEEELFKLKLSIQMMMSLRREIEDHRDHNHDNGTEETDSDPGQLQNEEGLFGGTSTSVSLSTSASSGGSTVEIEDQFGGSSGYGSSSGTKRSLEDDSNDNGNERKKMVVTSTWIPVTIMDLAVKEIMSLIMTRLSNDPSMAQLAPWMFRRVAEGIMRTEAEGDFPALVFHMRIVAGLCVNPYLMLDENTAKSILPFIRICIYKPTLCGIIPARDEHWSFREYAAKVMVYICRKSPTPEVFIEFERIMYNYFLQDEHSSLGTIYGSIAGLGELGSVMLKKDVIPKLNAISRAMEELVTKAHSPPGSLEGVAKINELLLKYLPPLLVETRGRSTVKTPEAYREKFGIFGVGLLMAVLELIKKVKVPTRRVPNVNYNADSEGGSPAFAPAPPSQMWIHVNPVRHEETSIPVPAGRGRVRGGPRTKRSPAATMTTQEKEGNKSGGGGEKKE